MVGKKSKLDALIAQQSGGTLKAAEPETIVVTPDPVEDIVEEKGYTAIEEKMAALLIKKGKEPKADTKPGIVAAFDALTMAASTPSMNYSPGQVAPSKMQVEELNKVLEKIEVSHVSVSEAKQEEETTIVTLPVEKTSPKVGQVIVVEKPKKEKAKKMPKKKAPAANGLDALRAAVNQMENIETKKPHLLELIDDISGTLANLREELENL